MLNDLTPAPWVKLLTLGLQGITAIIHWCQKVILLLQNCFHLIVQRDELQRKKWQISVVPCSCYKGRSYYRLLLRVITIMEF